MYVPTFAITKGVVEFPVLAGLLGSINTIVEASTVPSASVSFAVIVGIKTPLFWVVVTASFTATGASFSPITVISKVLIALSEPSEIV